MFEKIFITGESLGKEEEFFQYFCIENATCWETVQISARLWKYDRVTRSSIRKLYSF